MVVDDQKDGSCKWLVPYVQSQTQSTVVDADLDETNNKNTVDVDSIHVERCWDIDDCEAQWQVDLAPNGSGNIIQINSKIGPYPTNFLLCFDRIKNN
ncbi:hypothetical protein L1887_25499 [Cichorium endivia]|nr:hypothetical protein L1887_25499 [Cichorium endivia]